MALSKLQRSGRQDLTKAGWKGTAGTGEGKLEEWGVGKLRGKIVSGKTELMTTPKNLLRSCNKKMRK